MQGEYGPLDLSEVSSLRVCTQDGVCSVRWELSLVLMKPQASPLPTTTHHPTLIPQQWHTRDWTSGPDEWGLGSLGRDGGPTLFRPGLAPVWRSVSVARLPAS